MIILAAEQNTNMRSNTCIVIQGPATYYDHLKTVWSSHIQDVVFSTWVGEESYFNESDQVIFSTTPKYPGVANLNYQVKSTLEGILWAESRGYERVLKMRSDMVPTNVDKFTSMFESFYLWTFALVPHEDIYFTDYFMCGDIHDMKRVWSIEAEGTWRYPEQAITNNIKSHCIEKARTCAHLVNSDNDVYSLKWNTYCSSYLPHWGYNISHR